MLAPYIEGHRADLLELAVRGLAAWDPFLAVLGESVTLPEYGRNGTLQAACNDEGVRELQEQARLLDAAGVPHKSLSGAEARTLERALADDVHAALEIPVHGYVAAGGFIEALVEAGTGRGASFTQADVLDVKAAGPGVLVTTNAGRIEGDAAVLATGSWAAELARRTESGAPLPVRPVKG